MYQLEINNQKFNYTIWRDSDEYGDYVKTIFYETYFVEKEIRKWSWKNFWFMKTGEIVKKEKQKTIFELPGIDIHNSRMTKGDVRKILEREIELLNREEEINRGEVV